MTDPYNGLPPGGKASTGGQLYTFRRNGAMSDLSPIQQAALVQAYDELPALFKLAIGKELKNGRKPEQIAKDFLDVVSILPGHRAEGAKRIENAAWAAQMGLVEE